MKLSFTQSLLLLLPITLLSCSADTEKKGPDGKNDTALYTAKPPDPHLSKLKLEEQLSNEIRESLAVASDTMVEEAAAVVAETRNALRYLLANKTAEAQKSIESAIGKAEVVTATKPNMSLVPLDVNVTVYDLVTYMDVLKKIRDDVEYFIDKGYLQDARQLLLYLRSELTISTSSLPFGTYPDALKEAGRLNKERKPIDAALLLSTALSTIASEERSVPLPLIRAEAMLKEVDSLLGSGNDEEEEIHRWLDNADYQIRFAEALGYGKRDKEFKEFYEAIKSLNKEVTGKSSSSRKSNTDLRNKLDSFKRRISPKTPAKRS
jgi:hypothetical protein